MSLASLSVRRPIATTMLLGAAVLLGGLALPRLEVGLLPDVRASTLGMWIGWRNAGVAEVEEAIARPVEEALLGTPGVRGVEARVRDGGASFVIELHRGNDPELVALSVRERLDSLRWTLPETADRPVVTGGAGDEAPAMVLALARDDLVAATDWAETVLAPRLEQVDGIARAFIVGGMKPEIRVVPDPDAMAAAGVGPAEIAAAIRSANVDSPGGVLRRRGTRFSLRVDSRLADAGAVAAVPIDRPRGPRLNVADVARIEDGIVEPDGWGRLDGRPAVGVLLYRESGRNLLLVTKAVRAELARLEDEFPGLDLAVVADSSPFVRQAVSGVWQAIWLGGLLAFAVLFAFLRDVRSPVFLVVALPVSVISTFAVLDVVGVSLNLMSLGGLALGVGMLVDNGIVCLENVHRLRGEGHSPAESAARGAREISLPILASTLTTCAVFLPLATVPGAIGDLFRDQAIAVSVSLGVSLVVAMTLLPVLAAKWPSRPGEIERRPLFGLYHRLLLRALGRPAVLFGLVGFLLAGSLLVLAVRPREVLPPVATDHLEITLELPPGTDVSGTDAASGEIERWLSGRPDVATVFAAIGDAGSLDLGDEARRVHRAVLRTVLVAPSPARRAHLLDELNATFADRPGWKLGIGQDAPGLAALVRGDEATLTATVAGPDAITVERAADTLANAARKLLGDDPWPLRVETATREPRVRLVPKDEAFARLGLTEAEVLPALTAATSGYEATRIRRFDEEVPVVIHAPGSDDPAAATLFVGGRRYPVRELYEPTTVLAPSGVTRRNQTRVATLTWDGPLREAGRVQRALAVAAAGTALGDGVAVTLGGAWREMREILAGIARALAVSAGLVLLILAAQFESVRLPLVIFAAVPLGLIGVAAALLLTAGSINALSGIGIVVLVGIVVNDSILKVDLLARLRRAGVSRVEAVSLAGHRRYRPILMTTLTTVLGLAPLFLGRGAELRAPLAATIIGGLLSSTLLTLVVVPVLFDRIAGESLGRGAAA